MSDALTIVIPTYNRWDLLGDCLTSIGEQSGVAIKVLVVDDGSEEDVEGYLKEHFMGVEVIRSAVNRGFAATVNMGLREVDTDYVMLLNNDMTLEPECIERMMAGLHEQDVDMVAPLVVWKDDPETIYSAGDRVLKNGRPESYGFRKPRKDFKFPKQIFGVSAGAAIYKKGVFDKIGLFDEKFIAYFEDADWCFRARLAGFTAGLVPEAVARHVGSASQFGATWWRSRQCYRNYMFILMKDFPFLLILKNIIWIKMEQWHQASMVVSSARTEFGLFTAILILLKAFGGVLLMLPYMLAVRWKIQWNRKLSAREVEALLGGSDD